nr:hypothetical protein [Tanacetum cinerariifolium]
MKRRFEEPLATIDSGYSCIKIELKQDGDADVSSTTPQSDCLIPPSSSFELLDLMDWSLRYKNQDTL